MSYIAFDSKSLQMLLGSHNSKYFSDEFPLFYQNMDGTSMIDTAINRNQIRSLNMMMDYIVNY